MEKNTNPIAQKLMKTFMQFTKVEWHQRSIAGCTPGEIRALFCIRKGTKPDASEMKVSEISKLLHVTSPTITQMLKGLEANGLVARHIDPTDRRVVGITLTEKGEMVTQQVADAFSASIEGLTFWRFVFGGYFLRHAVIEAGHSSSRDARTMLWNAKK